MFFQDNPEAGVLYLMRGLLNVLQNYQWEASSDAKVIIYSRCLAMLSAMCQDQLPYHVDKGKETANFGVHFPHAVLKYSQMVCTCFKCNKIHIVLHKFTVLLSVTKL